jgi:hypothetical protein
MARLSFTEYLHLLLTSLRRSEYKSRLVEH